MLDKYPASPDGRYFVVRRRRWRKGDPALEKPIRNALLKDLTSARQAVRDAKHDCNAIAKARNLVGDAEIASKHSKSTGLRAPYSVQSFA